MNVEIKPIITYYALWVKYLGSPVQLTRVHKFVGLTF